MDKGLEYEARYEMVDDWYMREFPYDNMGKDINHICFDSVLRLMNIGEEFYSEIIGVHDSVIRERIFWRLAYLYDVDYDDIYDLWRKQDDIRAFYRSGIVIYGYN